MKQLVDLIQQQKKLITFLTVGVLTAAVYFSLFTVLWKWLHLNYKIAVSISYCFAVMFQFFLNRHVTFKSGNENVLYQVIKFGVLLLINYILTIAIVTWSVNTLMVTPYLGIIISLTVTVFTGFYISTFWVYKASPSLQPSGSVAS